MDDPSRSLPSFELGSLRSPSPQLARAILSRRHLGAPTGERRILLLVATVLATVRLSIDGQPWPFVSRTAEGSRDDKSRSLQIVSCRNATSTTSALSVVVSFALVCRPSPYMRCFGCAGTVPTPSTKSVQSGPLLASQE